MIYDGLLVYTSTVTIAKSFTNVIRDLKDMSNNDGEREDDGGQKRWGKTMMSVKHALQCENV